jgi:hypothetical protein
MKSSKLIFAIALTWLVASCASHSQKTDGTVAAQSNSTPVLWTAKESVNTPESAYYDQISGDVFVSNINGKPDEKDGNGYISKYTIAGQLVNAKWSEGFNAPKGLRAAKGNLWVADIDQVVSVDLASGKINRRYPVKGAKFLNDIAVDDNGVIYVSDTMGNKIFMIKNNKVSVFKAGTALESPNGLYVDGGKLVVASWGAGIQPDFSSKEKGHLYSLDLKTKVKTLITTTPLGNLDGLERAKDGSWFVSDWLAGRVYKVAADGSSTLLIEGLKGAADLGWDQSTNTIIVPRMMEGQVSAYTVQ